MHPTAAAGGTFLLGGDHRVNRLGLGAMRFALGGSVRDPETAVAVLRRAVELGVNHIDTAGTYGFGDLHAHELVRRALSPYPADLVIATSRGANGTSSRTCRTSHSAQARDGSTRPPHERRRPPPSHPRPDRPRLAARPLPERGPA